MTAQTRLTLIRHGESRAQSEGFLSGHDTCKGLSDAGRRQAEALRDRLLATGELAAADAVYTSILPRAIETAEIIAPALGELAPQQECAWCEIHAGEAEGLTWAEVEERYPNRGGPADPFRARLPGAETWAEFLVRAGARLRRTADDHPGEHVVVVCHGGVVGASFVALGEVPLTRVSMMMSETLNTSLTDWRWDGTTWRLVRYNDAAHLSSV
jgi:probable phosphoglycerate mutase